MSRTVKEQRYTTTDICTQRFKLGFGRVILVCTVYTCASLKYIYMYPGRENQILGILPGPAPGSMVTSPRAPPRGMVPPR